MTSDPRHFFADWTRENSTRRSLAQLVRDSRGPRNWGLAAAAATVVALGVTTLTTAGSAQADPSADQWYRLRMCESSNNYAINTGNGYYGAYQFDLSTWRSVGGQGYPHQNSKAEQDYRALRLYRQRGWQPWECASILGLASDRDAGSGRFWDIPKPGSGGGNTGGGNTGGGNTGGNTGGGNTGGSSSGVPMFPGGSHWYTYGEWNNHIKRFQDQMHKRGFFPVGTGEYGPNTLRMVKRLQQLNGLIPNGYIGPNTWRMAWKGKYSEAAAPAKPKPTPKPTPKPSSSGVPAFPGGSHWYFYGDWNNNIKRFQDQMHKRGHFPVGTGEYGPNTLRMVKRLQQLNGLVPNGLIGPNTWKLAWKGKY
ncbi:transglycosylase family protein [Jatrophihabitans fulvus]